MKIRVFVLFSVFALLIVFMILNWATIMAPTALNLAVAQVNAPFGLVMLGIITMLTALFLIYIVYLQTSVLFEARRHAKELQINRELADKAEASRFTELREFLNAQNQSQVIAQADLKNAFLSKVDVLNADMNQAINQSSNAIFAYIGELEDRLETRLPKF